MNYHIVIALHPLTLQRNVISDILKCTMADPGQPIAFEAWDAGQRAAKRAKRDLDIQERLLCRLV